MGLLHEPSTYTPDGGGGEESGDWEWGTNPVQSRQDPIRPPRPLDGVSTRVHSACLGTWQGEGAVLGCTAGSGWSGSRLQPSRLLLSLLCRLKMATVLELTPGDPGSFLPHLRTGTLCSQSLLLPALAPPPLSLLGSLGSWLEVKPTAARPAHLRGGWGQGRSRAQTGRPFFPLSPPLPAAPASGRKVGREGRGDGGERKGCWSHPFSSARALRSPGGVPPLWFLRFL